jgi:hypothetical protein
VCVCVHIKHQSPLSQASEHKPLGAAAERHHPRGTDHESVQPPQRPVAVHIICARPGPVDDHSVHEWWFHTARHEVQVSQGGQQANWLQLATAASQGQQLQAREASSTAQSSCCMHRMVQQLHGAAAYSSKAAEHTCNWHSSSAHVQRAGHYVLQRVPDALQGQPSGLAREPQIILSSPVIAILQCAFRVTSS